MRNCCDLCASIQVFAASDQNWSGAIRLLRRARKISFVAPSPLYSGVNRAEVMADPVEILD
jgi:hypothetical protein